MSYSHPWHVGRQKCFHTLVSLFIKLKKFGGNAIGNVAKQKSATLPRADDSGQY